MLKMIALTGTQQCRRTLGREKVVNDGELRADTSDMQNDNGNMENTQAGDSNVPIVVSESKGERARREGKISQSWCLKFV